MKRILVIVLALGALGFLVAYFGDDHWRYRDFEEARAAWHRKCDVYIGTPATSAPARECEAELQHLMAYGKRQGWSVDR